MVGHSRGEGWGVVDRCGIQGVVVAGKQDDRDGECVENFESAGDDRAVELVGFEHVATDENELYFLLGGERTDAGNGVEAGTVEPRARLVAEVVRGHAQLPVPRGDESHLLLLDRSHLTVAGSPYRPPLTRVICSTCIPSTRDLG